MATPDYYVPRNNFAGGDIRAISWKPNSKDTTDLIEFMNSTRVKVVDSKVENDHLFLQFSTGASVAMAPDSVLLLNKQQMVMSVPKEAFQQTYIRKSKAKQLGGNSAPYVAKEKKAEQPKPSKGDFNGFLKVTGLIPFEKYSEIFQNELAVINRKVVIESNKLSGDATEAEQKELSDTIMQFCGLIYDKVQTRCAPGKIIAGTNLVPSGILQTATTGAALSIVLLLEEAAKEEEDEFTVNMIKLSSKATIGMAYAIIRKLETVGRNGKSIQRSAGKGCPTVDQLSRS